MTHLAPKEFVDAADGTLPQTRAAHLDTCDACRELAEGMGALLREVAAVEPPDPSPLFWEHFACRVHDAIAHERIPARTSWTWIGARVFAPLTAVAALVIAVVSGAVLPRLARTPAVAPPAVVAAAPAIEIEATVDPDNTAVWAVLTAAAADMHIDDAHAAGMTAHPAAVDRAVQRLNKEELAELGRLLQTELKRSGD